MAEVVEFITRLDFDALADNQLSGQRAVAVRRRLEMDQRVFEEVTRTALVNDVLKIAKPALYSDRDLRKAVAGLLRRRAA